MKYLIVLALVCTIYGSATSKPLLDGQPDLLPVKRYKRQQAITSVDLKNPGIATVSHTGTIVDNQNNLLTGTAYAAKDLSRGGGLLKPDVYGGKLDYSHKPSGSVVGLGADHFRGAGTNVKASGTWNFVNTKNAEVGLTGEYGRHFGAGGSRPHYGVFLGGTYRF